MIKKHLSVIICVLAVGCGGGGGTPTTPSTPAPSPQPTPAPQASTTITIVSSSGNGAFNPNPAQVPAGGSIAWRNNTGDTHVLVMNDGAPIGTVGPGASLTTQLSGSGGNFHCTTHPSMVGSINGTRAPDPPPDGSYDYGVR